MANVQVRWTRRMLIGQAVAGLAMPSAAGAQFDDPPGLTTAMSWQSPQFGLAVIWNDEWQADDANTVSDEANLLDRLTILHPAGTTLVVMFIEAGEETAADYARRLVRYRQVTNPDAHLVSNEARDDVSSLIYRARLDRQDVISLIEVRRDDGPGLLIVVEMIAYASDIDDAFAHVQSDVAVDEDAPYPGLESFPVERLS